MLCMQNLVRFVKGLSKRLLSTMFAPSAVHILGVLKFWPGRQGQHGHSSSGSG